MSYRVRESSGWLVVIIAVPLITGCTASLEKPEADFWDILIKAVGGAVALVGAAIAAATFLRGWRASTQAQIEVARKSLREKRAQVYDDILNQTGRIGNTRNGSAARRKAADAFWFIYWGPLPLVADLAVGKAANAFADALDHPDDEVGLRNASMELAKACRRSLDYADPGQYPSNAGTEAKGTLAGDADHGLGMISEQA